MTVIVSIITSALVCLVMMKWHIHNTNSILSKHLDDNDIWFKEHMEELIRTIIQHTSEN